MYLVLGRNPFAMKQEISASLRMGSAHAASDMECMENVLAKIIPNFKKPEITAP